MKLEDQVCSLELAKRLKELHVPQESIFYYQGRAKEIEYEKGFILSYGREYRATVIINVSAFTVAELGLLLPPNVQWKLLYYKNTWNLDFGDNQVGTSNEANGRAKMLIWMVQNNYITL